jgi:hypothetical protein
MKRSQIDLIKALLSKGVAPSQIVTLLQIRAALSDCSSVLDIGCGPDSALSLFGFKKLVGIEGYAPSVERAKQAHTHDEVLLGDVRQLPELFGDRRFDACVALDLIEHLEKPEGLRLIQNMEALATRKVLFLTPNGFLPQRHAEQSDLQEHLSGWTADEMRKLGYNVVGVLGPKQLRGEYHRLTRKPEAFWSIISLLSHFLYTRSKPEKAAAILCVKSR